jgi:alkyl hydroperoxide reductase subunit AhpC
MSWQIADPERTVANLYEMLDEQDATNVSEDGQMYTVCPQRVDLPYTSYLPTSTQIRTVFIIDPQKTIRALLLYPASVGRDFDEILRCRHHLIV